MNLLDLMDDKQRDTFYSILHEEMKIYKEDASVIDRLVKYMCNRKGF